MSQGMQDLLFFTSPEEEFWKSHPFLEIEVSNQGRVRKGDYMFTNIIDDQKYVRIRFKYISHKVHRLVAQTWLPKVEDGFSDEVDHINGNRSDNRLQNLRWVHKIVNARNKHKVKGVEKMRNKFRVRVQLGPKKFHFGTFQDEEEAKVVAKKARSDMFDVVKVAFDLFNEVVEVSKV